MNPLPAQRVYGFDLLRMLAAFAVVWIHVCDPSSTARGIAGHWVYWAVPVFLMMAAFLTQRKLLSASLAPSMRVIGVQRLRRLLPSYLGWTVLYVVIRYLKGTYTGESSLENAPVNILFFGGAAMQLYFIPMLLGFTILFTPLILFLLHKPLRQQTVILATTGVLLLLLSHGLHRPDFLPSPAIFTHAWGMLGYYLLGAAACCWHSQYEGRHSTILHWSSLILFVMAGFLWQLAPYRVALQSLSLFLFALTVAEAMPAWIRYCSAASYGIFLSHTLFSEAIQFTLFRMDHSLESLSMTVFVFVAASTCALILSRLCLHIKALRWLVQ